MKEKPLIGIIGQGFVGGNYSDDFEERGYDVVRYALEERYEKNKERIAECDIVFIAVPTPTVPADTSSKITKDSSTRFEDTIIRAILPLVGKGKIAVIKSTILPGTTKKLQEDFSDIILLMSPEFLRVVTAAHDARNPFSNIIGMPKKTGKHQRAAEAVHAILPKASFTLTCDSTEAEVIKYAHNASGYTQIILFNLLYDVAKKVGCDWEPISLAIKADPLISNYYSNPIHKNGRGAGGACFIKDVAALRGLYETLLDDPLGRDVLKAMEAKNIGLLTESKKDLDLLKGVYGDTVIQTYIH